MPTKQPVQVVERRERAAASVALPEGVQVKMVGPQITIQGPQGTVQRTFQSQLFKMQIEGTTLQLTATVPGRRAKSIINSVASHIENCLTGVQHPYVYKMKVCAGHFPITVKVDGAVVKITNFLGEKIPRIADILPGASVVVQGDKVEVKSPDLEAAGQTAANIERATLIRKRDRRVFQDGIFIIEKPE